MDAFEAIWQLSVEHPVSAANVLVEIAGEVPAEVGGLVELIQAESGIDAAPNDFGIFLPKLIGI